ncbi:MAG: DUF2723 domain-containing protein [candidate division Zixibacteria bacterium]|nr:DUF2723 domain-containing protein [candidate division Zixibacteria bacterium]
MKKYAGLIPGLIALIVYYTTTCRSIWIGDSGEFSLALKTLGICHPPGYPLFTILGKSFLIFTSFLRPMYAANLFNTLIAAAVATTIYYLFRRYLNQWPAMILSLIWAFTPLFWSETAGVEIYTFNMLLIALIFLAIESNHKRRWLIIVYLFGLAMTNHPSALAILPVLIYLFIKEKIYKRWNIYPYLICILIITGSIYLYLLVRSSCDPLSNWGNPSNIKALIHHMTLSQYSGWLGYSWDNILISIKLFFISIIKSWWWIGLVMSVIGTIIGLIKSRTQTIGVLLMLAALLFLSSSLLEVNYEPYNIPALFAALLLMSNVFVWLESFSLSSLVRYSIYSACSIACLILLVINYNTQNKSDYTLYEDYSKYILDSAESGILFTAGDINSFGTLYLRYVEGYRKQVKVYDRSIRLSALLNDASQLTGIKYTDYYNARLAIINNAAENKYLVKNHYAYEPEWLNISEPFYSYGILYSINNKQANSPNISKYPIDYKPGDVLSRQLLVNLDLARGEKCLTEEPYDTTAAFAAFNLALNRLENEPRAVVLNNLGIYFRSGGYLELAHRTYIKALEKPIITASTRQDITFNISNLYKDRGNNHLASKDYHNAIGSYIRALNYDPDNTDLMLNIGLIFSQILNDTANACIYLEKYLDIKPSDTKVRNFLDKIK